MASVPGALSVVVGDLSTIVGMRQVAEQANALGRFDAVIHNAGIYLEPALVRTADGVPNVLAVNTLAPYVLTGLMERPDRLIYLSSGMHLQGHASLRDLTWNERPWNPTQAYSDTKLHDLLLALSVARRWSGVGANAVNPGWVPTRMGGPGAPDSLAEGFATQAWLAAGVDPASRVTGQYLFHQKTAAMHPKASDMETQEALLTACEALTGIKL